MIIRKFWVLVSVFVFTNSFLIKPVMADDEVVNEPITEGEVLIATFDETGKLVPIGEPGTFTNGVLDVEIPASVSPETPLVMMIQDPNGEGTPQMAFITDPEAEIKVDAAQTAIVNTFMSMASEVEDFDAKDVDVKQIAAFVEKLEPVLEDVPPDTTTSDTMARMAQAMSLNPGAFMDAASAFNADPEKIFEIAAMVDEAAGASFNPLEGLPTLPDEPAVGNPTMGLIPPEFMKKMPPGFKPENICADCPPPGGFIGEIPKGSFMMPPLQTNPKAPYPFPPNVVMPQGVEITKGFNMPAGAILPPGIVIGEGFVPPAGLKFPPGMVAPADFDPSKFGATQSTEFKAPDGFKPGPGFTLADDKGGFMMPPGFAVPSGAQMPTGAMAFPQPAGFVPPPPPPGSFKSDMLPPPPGFAFGEGFKAPPGFNPEAMGFVPPAGFVPQQIGPKPSDLNAFKGDNAQFFDPFGGKFAVPTNGSAGPFVPPAIATNLGFIGGKPPEGVDPSAFFNMPPPQQGGANGVSNPSSTDGGANKPTIGGGNPPPPQSGNSGGQVPNNPPPTDGGANKPSVGSGSTNPPPQSGGNQVGSNPPPPQSGGDQVGSNPPPPQSGDGGSNMPPPPPSARIKARSIKSKIATFEDSSNKAGVRSTLQVTTSAKAKRLTASKGVYLIGKAKASTSKALVTMIVDPSITSDSVKISLGLTNNEVDTQVVDLENDAIQLITQLDGKTIEMTTANSGITDIAATAVTGYLLAPGTSAYKMQSAIAIKGKVIAGDSGDIVQFTLPAKVLADGVYTVTFQDGDAVYYGKLTIGTLKARTISGKALAPNGQL